MYWSLLAILLAGTPVPDKLSPYRGQTVVWVEIEAPAYEDVFELQRLVEIHSTVGVRMDEKKTVAFLGR